MAGNVPKEHEISGLSRPHVPETGQQSQNENSSNIVKQMKQLTVAEAHKSTLKSEQLCQKKLKITDIDGNVFMRICRLLNITHVLGGDYRTLAANLGYKVIDIHMFSQEGNATKSLLFDWSIGKGNTAEKILNILIKMDRDDIVELLNKEFENCNCQNCASLY